MIEILNRLKVESMKNHSLRTGYPCPHCEKDGQRAEG